MTSGTIERSTIDFLKALAKHNDREWFAKNKDKYTAGHENMIAFAGAVLAEMNRHDTIETPSGKASLFRIYRDVRFSKEKTPYNTCWNGGFKRATKLLRGGYYFHIEPGKSFVGGGFWGPNTADMQRIRQDIDMNHDEWRRLLRHKTVVTTFGGLTGEQLATAPRGYAKDHPAIDLLRYKQYLLKHDFTDEEVLHADFAKKVSDTFRKMRPFLDHMSEVLTTDVNGERIVG